MGFWVWEPEQSSTSSLVWMGSYYAVPLCALWDLRHSWMYLTVALRTVLSSFVSSQIALFSTVGCLIFGVSSSVLIKDLS